MRVMSKGEAGTYFKLPRNSSCVTLEDVSSISSDARDSNHTRLEYQAAALITAPNCSLHSRNDECRDKVVIAIT
jgi:hypothetical protein